MNKNTYAVQYPYASTIGTVIQLTYQTFGERKRALKEAKKLAEIFTKLPITVVKLETVKVFNKQNENPNTP